MRIKQTSIPLTALAHQKAGEVLVYGDFALDLTVGNGHDTLFLAKSVGENGRVLGFDIQDRAIEFANNLLDSAGLIDRVSLINQGHEELANQVPENWKGKVAALMMNLGYLPGGDKTIITKRDTTLAALESAGPFLRPEAVLTIVVYRGHDGGLLEAEAVEKWAEKQSRQLSIYRPARVKAQNYPMLLSLS